MHAAAMSWIGQYGSDDELRILDVGGRNINGTPADFFPNAEYTVVDLHEHSSVDIVGDILEVDIEPGFDVIVYAEVAEHTVDWAAHLAHMYDLLVDDGLLVITAAGPDRAAHSAVDGGPLRDGEHYENIDPELLADELYALTDYVQVDVLGDDVRAIAVKV